MHQFKINAKAAFDGEQWQWHQGYGTWLNDDEMPALRALNVALDAGHDLQTTSYPLWTIDHATISRLVAEGGLISPKGKAGSVMFFYGTIVHASPGNLSLDACDNAIHNFRRPDSITHRDFTPIFALGEDALRSSEVAR